MDPSEEATGSLDDDASSSEGASSVEYISEVSEESTASEAAAAALEDVIDAVERRVDRQRRRAAVRQFVRRVRRTTVSRGARRSPPPRGRAGGRGAKGSMGRWLTRCPGARALCEETFPCVGAITKPFEIPRGRVNDGVADCCGGSDEFGGDVRCIRDAQQQLEEARREVTRMESSMAARRKE